MKLSDFLTPDRVFLNVRARDKSHLITEIARNFGRTARTIKPDAVEAALLAREQLGSTGLGAGFALPHAKIEGLKDYVGMFLRLAKPIDFNSIDEKPVQLIFALLIPFETATPHVGALAAISRRFRNAQMAADLRKSFDSAAAYALLIRCQPTA